jgi:hypothetical protein
MTRYIVYHEFYGCDSGCCGHVVKAADEFSQSHFNFVHPYGEDQLEFARELVREQFGEEHVADLDWDNCVIEEY